MNEFEIIDPGYKEDQWVLAGKKRLFLAAYFLFKLRAYQGLPVREEMIEWFQAITPEAFLIVYAVIVIVLIILFFNFRKFTSTI